MSTNVGRTAHLARSIFLESLWWFAHRITGFMFSFSVPEPLANFRAELFTRQKLESDICPHTMVGIGFEVEILFNIQTVTICYREECYIL